MVSKEKQVFYITADNRVYSNFADIPSDASFEVCYGLLDLCCTAILSDATTAKLVKPMVLILLVVVFYFLIRIIAERI